MSEELKVYTTEEVSKHTSEDDCWMIIGNEQNGMSLILNCGKASVMEK